MHAVLDLHGRMSEASAKASGHYPLQERRHPEHKDTHLQNMGNQQHGRRFSVKSEGGASVAPGPKIQFFSLPLCHRQKSISLLEKQIYEALRVIAL